MLSSMTRDWWPRDSHEFVDCRSTRTAFLSSRITLTFPDRTVFSVLLRRLQHTNRLCSNVIGRPANI